MASLYWAFLAFFGFECALIGRRVLVDPDWENGDWWVLSSWFALRGAIFGFLFPVVRTEHTRRQERTNALWIMLWGLILLGLGVTMAIYVRSH